MKEIVLTNGDTALVDDEDYLPLIKFRWQSWKDYNTSYAVRRPSSDSGKRILICMHHAILGKPQKGYVTDHIDGNGLNNQRSNLRFVTIRENSQNRHHSKVSIHSGLCFDQRRGSWNARILINGKRLYLGSFPSENLAHLAYEKATLLISTTSGSIPEKRIPLPGQKAVTPI